MHDHGLALCLRGRFTSEVKATSGDRALVLAFRHPDDQAVQRVGHLDLAGQPRIGLRDGGEAQHARFLRSGWRQADAVEPRVIDIDMPGGTGALAAAIGIDAGDVVLDRPLHDGLADRNLDHVFGSIVLDIRYLRHWTFLLARGQTTPRVPASKLTYLLYARE